MEKRLIARGLAAGVIGAVLAFLFARLCAEPVIARAIAFEDGRLGAWNARLLAAGAYLAPVAILMVLLPTVEETPGPLRDAPGAIVYPGFPADDLYEFRLVSLATQLVLWASIGVVFATLAGRLLGERAEPGHAASAAT